VRPADGVSQVLVNISGEKAEVAKIEEALLEQMQQLETMGKAIGDLKVQIAAEQQVLAKMQAEMAEKASGIQSQINAVQQRGQTRLKRPSHREVVRDRISATGIIAIPWPQVGIHRCGMSRSAAEWHRKYCKFHKQPHCNPPIR
jgi:hypothetical protein